MRAKPRRCSEAVALFSSRRVQNDVKPYSPKEIQIGEAAAIIASTHGYTEDPVEISPIFRVRNDSYAHRIASASIHCRVYPNGLKPFFKASLLVRDAFWYCWLEPFGCTVENAFLRPLRRMRKMFETMLSIEHEAMPLLKLDPKLMFAEDGRGADSALRVMTMKLQEAEKRVRDAVQKEMAGPIALVELYQEFCPLLQIDQGACKRNGDPTIPKDAEDGDEEEYSESEESESDDDDDDDDDDDLLSTYDGHPSTYRHLQKRLKHLRANLIEVDEISRLVSAEKEIYAKSHDVEIFGLVAVDCRNVKSILGSAANALSTALMNAILLDAHAVYAGREEFQAMLKRMSDNPKDEF